MVKDDTHMTIFRCSRTLKIYLWIARPFELQNDWATYHWTL